MDIYLNPQQSLQHYSSNSQRARVLTETWTARNLYCPMCGHLFIQQFGKNRAVADFYCPVCQEQYELKSKNGAFGRKIIDGAYDTFIERIQAKNNPDFLFLNYCTENMQVVDLCFVPKFFFVPSLVERRRPLGEHARRHGWIGCNILFDQIPSQGRIPLIQNGNVIDKRIVLSQVQKALKMKTENLETRGWLFDIINCINAIPDDPFTLEQVYQFEPRLEVLHPENHNIRAKIRQQLQLLRNRGLLIFLGKGQYRKQL